MKNNLNIISSLLELQAMGTGQRDVRDAFIASQNRIISMALIHEKLYQTLTRQLGGTVIPSPPKKGSAVRIRFSPKGAAAYV